MIIEVILFASAFLLIIASVSAIWLLRVARSKLSWILISIAFVLMAIRRVLDYIEYTGGELSERQLSFEYWSGFFLSLLIAFSVIMIARMLHAIRRSEQAVSESEHRFRTLFHNSSDEIFLADIKGNFLEVNQVACDNLGYTPGEFKKMNFKDIKTRDYVDRVDRNIQKILAQGKHVYETEHLAQNGRVISLEMKSRLIDYEGSRAIFSIARDITERKQMERKILSEVINAEERERERIAKELHDDIGPLLSTIKLYVNEIKSEETDAMEKVEMIGQTNELIDEAISNTRAISNNLTPRVIVDFGLVKAVESFCKKVNMAHKLEIRFDRPHAEIKLDQTLELILYRVITELINNTIKHAEATDVNVGLELVDGVVQLTYTDNGKGFDQEKILNEAVPSGMGIRNMIGRLRSVNGYFKVHSQKGKGTLVVVEVALDKQKLINLPETE